MAGPKFSATRTSGRKAKSKVATPPAVIENVPVTDEVLHQASTEALAEQEVSSSVLSFPLVGIGASAGGLEAYTRILQGVPADTGMAFVLVQHLAPQSPSILASLLSRATPMPVAEVRSGTVVKPNCVYVIPPNTLMSIEGGVLKLEPRPRIHQHGAPMPIDYFFRSLAIDQKAGAIGVLLTGTDSDGTLGLESIRAEGGIAIVQTESSAKYPTMPRSAITIGAADLILAPEEIARELERIGRHPVLSGSELANLPRETQENNARLTRIFQLLRSATGVDFSGYKRGTIWRRIARRIILQRQENLETYLAFTESNRSEVLALHEELLINVTGFFRDPETFSAFETDIVPRLLQGRSAESPIRVWVPGCSTGEEVYSIAMGLIEGMADLPDRLPIQIFGTDLSERAIAFARVGLYPERQVSKLSPERQARFFVRSEAGYQMVKSIREMCVFARQNLSMDPPFSRLDLISCRNLLIYFGSALQQRVVATFHYALQPDGFLVLGHSESLRDFPDLFSLVNKEHKFYKRKAARSRVSLELIGRGFANERSENFATSRVTVKDRSLEVERTAERIVLSEYGPAWIVVNGNLEIIHSRGDTSAYLQLASGRPTFDLLKMARESIRGELRKLLAKAKEEDTPIRSPLLHLRSGEEIQTIRLEVRRISDSARQGQCFLVLFLARAAEMELDPREKSQQRQKRSAEPRPPVEIQRLRQELLLTTQRLQSIIDERDAANQDLTYANEEVRSSNEELQSINEELETSKEEVQSSNEELNTVNEELQSRNQELNHLTDDLTNLLSSTTIPILMLDNDLRIRRITSVAESLLNVRGGDIGRRIGEIRMRLSVDNLEPVVRKVLESSTAEEVELQDGEGRWHVLRVRPYLTADHRIAGAVVVLIDIDQVRRAQLSASVAKEFAEAIVESVHTPLLVLTSELHIRSANGAFYEYFKLSRPVGKEKSSFPRAEWKLPALQIALERLVLDHTPILDLEIEHQLAGPGTRTVMVNARPIQPEAENQILVSIEDITARKQAQEILREEQARLESSVESGMLELEKSAKSLQSESLVRVKTQTALHESEANLLKSREELRALTGSLLTAQDEERRRVSRELHDDLSQKTAKLQFDVETLEQGVPRGSKDLRVRLLGLRDQIATLSNELREVAYRLHPSTLDHLGLAVALRGYCKEFSKREGLQVQFSARNVPADISIAIASCFYRVTQEALRNVVKHAGKAKVQVQLSGNRNELVLSIADDGIGFDHPLVRSKNSLGLVSIEERARLIDGEFSLKTKPGQGVLIKIRVPLPGGGGK
jgi:two-component system CheB/CheR fusion protein